MPSKDDILSKEKLQELMNKNYKGEDLSLSFFDIINRSHDENLISLMIKYLFERDNDSLKNLLNKAYNNINSIEINDVITEYSIRDNKRIDILIRGVINNIDSIVVIENKVYSKEHDNQCELYYNYIENEYRNFDRYYLFLKPEYNKGKSNCNEFMMITYRDLLDSITISDDLYIEDFKKTIELNLVVRKMDELEKYILGNFHELYKMINNLDRQMINFLEGDYSKELKKHLGSDRVEIYKPDYSIRFYNKDCWSGEKEKDDMFYFYVELVGIQKDIKHFKFQRIIKRYSDNYDSKISKFLKDKRCSEVFGKRWFIIEKKIFESDKEILSEEWKEELIEKSKLILKQFFEEQKKDVIEFVNNYLS